MTTRDYMASKLREFRTSKGLSVDEVGAAINKSGKTISAWEVGRGQPDADKLVELCKLYEVRISDFYCADESQQPGEITENEHQFIETFKKLNDEGKRIAVAMVTALYKCGDYKN